MVIVWRLRGNIIRTALCWIVWHNVHSPQHTYVSSSYRSNRLVLSHWDPYAVRRGGCLDCIIVTWWSGSDGIQAWSRRPTSCLQCFDTVGWVIWPLKIVPEMTYYVSSGTLNPTQLNSTPRCCSIILLSMHVEPLQVMLSSWTGHKYKKCLVTLCTPTFNALDVPVLPFPWTLPPPPNHRGNNF